ncbi:hypothetical protein NDU88_005071 [Pleurodeles waltl]|uniref:Uncharacterized protein n=1 Tax=Pleurodeles waltl TaxID=8319 RepID=A0AAV7T9R6_PLEWA|nr:hypothetical protein NDU88_005071 [Pleurodeles waltl]
MTEQHLPFTVPCPRATRATPLGSPVSALPCSAPDTSQRAGVYPPHSFSAPPSLPRLASALETRPADAARSVRASDSGAAQPLERPLTPGDHFTRAMLAASITARGEE